MVFAMSLDTRDIKIVLNLGHRIHLRAEPDKLATITAEFAALTRNPRFKVATMSEYDFHYFRYYTGIELSRLPVVSLHVPRPLRDAPYSPQNRIVLVGPSQNTTSITGFDDDLESLNRASTAFALARQLEPYRFEFIKTLYQLLLGTQV